MPTTTKTTAKTFASTPPPKQAIGTATEAVSSDYNQQDEIVEKVTEALDREDSLTRQRIARQFVTIYFALLGLLLVGIPIYNIAVIRITQQTDLVIKLTDIVQTYSAVVGPTLGFVIAYYFKSKSD